MKRQGCKAGPKNVLITLLLTFSFAENQFVGPGYILPPTFAICYSFSSLISRHRYYCIVKRRMQNPATPNTRALPGEFTIYLVLLASGDYVTHPSSLFRLLGSSWGAWTVLPSNKIAN